jgi:hypothetical protein
MTSSFTQPIYAWHRTKWNYRLGHLVSEIGSGQLSIRSNKRPRAETAPASCASIFGRFINASHRSSPSSDTFFKIWHLHFETKTTSSYGICRWAGLKREKEWAEQAKAYSRPSSKVVFQPCNTAKICNFEFIGASIKRSSVLLPVHQIWAWFPRPTHIG